MCCFVCFYFLKKENKWKKGESEYLLYWCSICNKCKKFILYKGFEARHYLQGVNSSCMCRSQQWKRCAELAYLLVTRELFLVTLASWTKYWVVGCSLIALEDYSKPSLLWSNKCLRLSWLFRLKFLLWGTDIYVTPRTLSGINSRNSLQWSWYTNCIFF